MRQITDGAGTQWTVFEVKKQGGPSDRWSYLPEEYGDGWLCFESAGSKRRLTPIPTGWRALTDAQLTRFLEQAQTVNRPRFSVDNRPSMNE